MVLSHGTGLPNWGGERLTLQFEPAAYGYSGEGFVYLQKAIERATGQSLEALARREVFEPLGMARSSYVWQERFEGNAAQAKDWLWRVAPIDRWVEPNASYTLLTTAPRLRQVRGGSARRAGTVPGDLAGLSHARPRDQPGNRHGAGRAGRERPGRPDLLPQRQQRPAIHLLHDGRRGTSDRLRLLHQCVERDVTRRGTRGAGVPGRAVAP